MDSEAKRLSPDDVVSYNLRRARDARRWTQPEAAAQVSRYLGREWSPQVYGDAERAYRSARVKIFSAEEIVAFCRAFGLPLVWFYLPPQPWTVIAPRGADEGTADASMTGDDLLALIFPRINDPMLADLATETERLFTASAGQRAVSENLGAFLDWRNRQNNLLRSLILAEFEDIDQIPDDLEAVAARIRKALALVANDLTHEGIPSPDAEADPEGEQ